MSKKDYRQGMADAIENYVPFGEKQEAAIRHVGDQIKQTADKVDQLGGKIGDLVDYISDREKAELYKLNTPVDIADMGDAEKRVLLAVLYQLSANEESTTPEQQNYVRAVQQYLKIYNPQTMIDLGAVENIDSSAAAQAIMQTVLEFFYLGADLEGTLEKYNDFLCCFPVSRVTEKRVHRNIEAIIEVVGIQGLAEKYGIVAEQPRSDFAKYNDNGPIPEKIADLCVSYIKQGFGRFQSGEYVLETKDYLVMCKVPFLEHWEKIDAKDNVQNYGFFSIEKRSGKVARINIDYKKDFPFAAIEKLSFCIQENTVYFMENCVDREKNSEVHLVSIDFATKEFQKQPFKFSISSYNVPVRFHISCNEAYVMVYAYLLLNFSTSEDEKRPLSKIFVVDLTQGGRVFTLEPDLIIRDAFIRQNSFFILGATKGKDRIVSLFQYDVASKSTTDALEKYNDYRGGVMLCLDFCFPYWVDRYDKNYLIEEILRIEDTWYFKYRIEKRMYSDWEREVCFIYNIQGETGHGILQNIISTKYNTPILLRNHVAIGWAQWKDEPNCHLIRRDLLSNEDSYPDKGADNYILLGDYLYKHCNGDWYKANISQGWEMLQWELTLF